MAAQQQPSRLSESGCIGLELEQCIDVDAVEGLVDDRERALEQERRDELDLLAHAVGVVLDEVELACLQLVPVEEVVDP